MKKYKLKTGQVGEKIVDTYKKIEETFIDTFLEKGDEEIFYTLKTGEVAEKVVDGYKAIEDTVVDRYRKIEEKFIEAFLEEVENEEISGCGNATEAEKCDLKESK